MDGELQKCCFVHHPNFTAELEQFVIKHGSIQNTASESVNHIQNLLTQHFFGPQLMFTPKHLGRAEGFGAFEIYWLHLVIPGCRLSRTQFPKAYFYKNGNHISFLCLDSHLQNYKDSKLRSVANTRLQEILLVPEKHKCELL
jgi:hypothetical protein